LGGNVHALGKRKDGSLWKVGIADPQDTTKYVGKLNVSDKAVITSGGYQRFFEKDGVIYHHIINPKTGKSANSGLLSVTIISDSGITADGLSTSLFVMGLEKSTELWRESKDFEAVFVDNSDKIYVTSGLVNSFETDREYEIIE
jgi:thiamine biosynthesis lipoprotein